MPHTHQWARFELFLRRFAALVGNGCVKTIRSAWGFARVGCGQERVRSPRQGPLAGPARSELPGAPARASRPGRESQSRSMQPERNIMMQPELNQAAPPLRVARCVNMSVSVSASVRRSVYVCATASGT